MAWPTAVITTGMDADTDSVPRSDILDLTTKFNAVLAYRGVADGICDLDGAGLVPNVRLDAELAAIAGLTSAADKGIHFTGLGAASVHALTPFARTLLDDADAATAHSTLGISSILGTFRKLQVSATGTSATVTVSADELSVESASNTYQTLRSVSLSINSAGAGANGLDTGTLAATTWYSVWVIWNGTTTAGLISASTTAPTMPSGYTHKARIGWIRTDGTSNKYPLAFKQGGEQSRYVVAAATNVTSLPVMSSGVVGTLPSTYAAVATSAFVPPTASRFFGAVNNPSPTAVFCVAPNAGYGAYNSLANPPPVWQAGSAGDFVHEAFDMLLESTDIYYLANSGGNLVCTGWEDNL